MANEPAIGELRCSKATGTYADVLFAIGQATIVNEIWPTAQVTVGDAGDAYVVSIEPAVVRPARIAKLSVGYPYLAHEKAKPPPKGISPSPYPYVEEKRKEDLRKKYDQAQRQAGRRRKKKNAEELAAEPSRPERRFALMKAINSLRSGSESWNELARSIQAQIKDKSDEFYNLVFERLSGIHNRETPLDEASFGVLQAFLPTAGKGTNRAKPDGAKLDNLKGPWKDWFSEWCKYRGVLFALNAQFIKSDIKLQCLLPGTRADLVGLRAVADEFAAGSWLSQGRAFTNVKSDVFALIGLAHWLIEHSEFSPAPRNRLYRFIRTAQPAAPKPRDFIAGIATAYFKDLGAGRALANTNALSLPDWFPVTKATYENWLSVLDEHRRVLTGLDENMTEEAALLVAYRDAISGDDIGRYLNFFSDFGANALRRSARGDYTEQFVRSVMEVLLMGLSHGLNPSIPRLIKDPAFLAIADAVHEATVKAQYWKGQGQPEYEIHYGLAQRWKRAADRSGEFVQVLCDFTRSYNEENAKRKEKGSPSRQDVSRNDLDKMVGYLISEEIDSRTVCLLLLAYGFAMTDDERQHQELARAKAKAERASRDAN